MGLTNSPLCRWAEVKTSAYVLCECEALALLTHAYLGSFSWTQRTWESGGHLVLQEQGSHNLVSDYGAQSACLKA